MRGRPLLLACWAIAVAAAALAVFAGVRWNGGLGHLSGSGVSLAVRPGQPFTVGMTELKAGGRVRIESVRAHRPDGLVALVGALVHPEGHGMIGSERRYPPRSLHVGMRPAAGAVIPAHSGVVLEVGFVVRGVGRAHIDGVDVLYRERWHGLDLRRRAHVGMQAYVCGTNREPRLAPCPFPGDER